MNAPQFDSKEAFEAYLNNSESRLVNQAYKRRNHSLGMAIPVAILFAIGLFTIPEMLTEWAREKTQWKPKLLSQEDIEHSHAKGMEDARRYQEAEKALLKKQLDNRMRVEMRANHYHR